MIKTITINKEDGTATADIANIVDAKTITLYVNSFTEESAKLFYIDFNKAIKSGQDIIPIIIDSYGGAVDSLISMMDVIESSPVPVATICLAKAISCGSILLSCGKNGMRYIAPSARVMIHHISSFSWDKLPEMKVSVKETERLQELIFEKMAKNCGKKKTYFLDILKRGGNLDWYLTPRECLKHNLVNHIKVPQFKTNITVENTLE